MARREEGKPGGGPVYPPYFYIEAGVNQILVLKDSWVGQWGTGPSIQAPVHATTSNHSTCCLHVIHYPRALLWCEPLKVAGLASAVFVNRLLLEAF